MIPFVLKNIKKHARCLVFILGTSGIQRLIVCEYTEASLSCPHHAGIHVLSAMFGRKDNRTCYVHDHSNITCVASYQGSLRTVKNACEGRQNCMIWASSNIFGDPCPGICKYLDLSYQCIFKQGMYG